MELTYTKDGGLGYWKALLARKAVARESCKLRRRRHKNRKRPFYVGKRDDCRVKRFTKRILKRDGYGCVRCGSKDGLVVHHIKTWASAPYRRLDPANAMTLCADCHGREHDWLKESPERRHLASIAQEAE